jgi:hypothetical protein
VTIAFRNVSVIVLSCSQLAQLAQLKQQQSNQTAVLSQLTAALSAASGHAAANAAAATSLQVLSPGAVILQPQQSVTSQASGLPQQQVLLINSATLQPQLIVPAGQVGKLQAA